MAPVLKRLYDQMADPKYVVAVGGCAVSGGPFKKSYHVVNGVDLSLIHIYIQRQSTTRSLQGNDSCSPIGRYIKHDIVEVKIITVSKVFC